MLFRSTHDQGLSTIYFGSNRPGGIGGFDVYETWTTDEDLESAVWGPGMLVPELSSPKRDTRTFVRRDGREVFITTDRDFGVGGLDIWVAAREDSSNFWSTPVNPGPPLNSAAGDPSSAALFRGGPGLTGVDQRPEESSRVATQMSRFRVVPTPPGRSVVMKISRPSFLTDVRVSRAGLLSSGTSTPGLQTAFSKSSSVVVVA